MSPVIEAIIGGLLGLFVGGLAAYLWNHSDMRRGLWK